ncbi:MAG: helix-turn-helix domain-containing protein [Cytophagales bacterium]|nr:MAG: helix-turn-helix domain-containing protein [Cytophagales bacterium]
MLLAINSERDYNEAMAQIEVILVKGSANMTEAEMAELQRLSLLAEQYEDVHYPMPVEPATLPEMIRLRMFQENMKQKDAAQTLGISETRLSEVLAGKRRVNMDLAKRLHERLRIRAEFILKAA